MNNIYIKQIERDIKHVKVHGDDFYSRFAH